MLVRFFPSLSETVFLRRFVFLPTPYAQPIPLTPDSAIPVLFSSLLI